MTVISREGAGDPVNAGVSDYWMPAGACHRAALAPTRWRGMTVFSQAHDDFCATHPLDCDPPHLKSM